MSILILIVSVVFAITYDRELTKNFTIDVSANLITKIQNRNYSNLYYTADCIAHYCDIKVYAEKNNKRRFIDAFKFDKYNLTDQEALAGFKIEIKRLVESKFNPYREFINGTITLE